MKTAVEIEHIREILPGLSKSKLKEVYDFVCYLREKERKHKAFVKRILAIEKNPDTIRCSSVEEVMEAIKTADIDEED